MSRTEKIELMFTMVGSVPISDLFRVYRKNLIEDRFEITNFDRAVYEAFHEIEIDPHDDARSRSILDELYWRYREEEVSTKAKS